MKRPAVHVRVFHFCCGLSGVFSGHLYLPSGIIDNSVNTSENIVFLTDKNLLYYPFFGCILSKQKPDTSNSVNVAHYKWNYSMINWSDYMVRCLATLDFNTASIFF